MTSTRWWWVRHAPVTANNGRMYGASDPPADLDDDESFASLAQILPAGAVWVTSHLRRARDTASTIRANGLDGETPFVEEGFGEQCFGDWQGMLYSEIAELEDKPRHRFWFTTPEHRPPGGETYLEVMARVNAGVDRISAAHAGRDIVTVAHGGSIRAAVAHALDLDAEGAMTFLFENLSVTRLDRIENAEPGMGWQVQTINRPARSRSQSESGNLA
ncbi:MAG: histidine phosphatase family protein [Alphaproteobacteria bacterium]|nr:histidine phosphatase family protein [Alphaproteobacteria bacterium]